MRAGTLLVMRKSFVRRVVWIWIEPLINLTENLLILEENQTVLPLNVRGAAFVQERRKFSTSRARAPGVAMQPPHFCRTPSDFN